MAGMGDATYVDEEAEMVAAKLLEFLESHESPVEGDELMTIKEYIEQVTSMKTYGKTTLYIDFTHLSDHSGDLAASLIADYYRYESALRRGVQRFVKKYKPGYELDDGVPKEFYVAFYNMPTIHKLRHLRSEAIGQLVSVSGVVTRTSEVRPELLYGTFKCLECGSEIADVAQQFKYTHPIICTNATCANRDKWSLQRHSSKFVDWQRVRLQEMADEVPAGSLPRTLDVILRHEVVEQARAGDRCTFTGTLIVVPDVGSLSSVGDKAEAQRGEGGARRGEGVRGLKALGVRDLSYKMAFLAGAVQSTSDVHQLVNIRAEDDESVPAGDLFSAEDRDEFAAMKNDRQLYSKLISSVCPAVYGHADVKKAIVLMLFGGVHKQTAEGINLRGDINVCIVGDPSCAKSQFLKYVAGFLPRAVYTSGKSSSAAGLTASVVKEAETGEFCIEAGALMLADNGICCIDEFDKMDVKDQVAIHEAMEQQTISIAKAGIKATLNARTSILAAANPAAGRYDKSKPLKYNVALPPAILSRFDLVHVMVDEPDAVHDRAVAHHIVSVHQKKDAAVQPDYSTLQLQKYIKFARTIKPQMTDHTQRLLVEAFVALRRGDATPGSRTAYRITVRQLEALIRLSEAMARLDLDSQIGPKHVKEAKRLLSTSIISVDSHEYDLEEEEEEGGGGEVHLGMVEIIPCTGGERMEMTPWMVQGEAGRGRPLPLQTRVCQS